MSRVLSIVAAMAIVGSVAVVDGATTAHALPTSCSVRYSWAKQMTVIPAYANRHFQPGQGTCSSDSYLYFGWVGVNGQIIAPDHIPAIDSANNYLYSHAAGWLDVT